MLIGPNALDPVRHPAENAECVRRIVALLTGHCRPRVVKRWALSGLRERACGAALAAEPM
jgi:hypothetical protein